MVSIDPTCPRHGKYSRAAWLRKRRTKSAEVKVGPRQQIVPKARESKDCSRQGKCESKREGAGRSISSDFWKPLDKFYLHMLDKDVVEKPTRVAISALKRRKGENVEPSELKQLAVPGANVAPILSQKQHNILSMHNQKQNFIAGGQSYKKKSAESKLETQLIREEQCVREGGSLECNVDQMSVTNKSIEMEVKWGTPLPDLDLEKKCLPVSDLLNEFDSVSPTCRCSSNMALTDKLRSQDLAGNGVTSISSVEMVTSPRREKNVSAHCTAPAQEYSNNRQKRELSKDSDNKCRETYASQYTRMCRLKGLNRNCFSIYDEAVDSRERQDKPFLDRHQVSEIDMNMDSKVSLPARECIQQGNDHITDETAIKLVGDEQPTSIMKEHQQAASDVFSSKELELARHKLEKIAYTAKALQLGLKDHPSREEMPITKTTIDRNEARDWLPKTAFARVTENLPDISRDSGRVRQLVQTFESMK
ncbi:hypothetical protein KC19_10G040100 [Ceratodon purpureus]|uniref:Uncharacterized protein n=1 Tax=Ceratodon purpureus TaxID=3225 RepID=A0A8T0GGX5_CERPU|nr:hypothetical protein KC19_10G040100 [Ceratodon purpureus]